MKITINGEQLDLAPGDRITLVVAHLGRDPLQGVAYTVSGSKVIVRDGADFLGKSSPLIIEDALIGLRTITYFARRNGLVTEGLGVTEVKD